MRLRCTVLDDYQGVARSAADWSRLDARVDVSVLREHVAAEEDLVARLAGSEVVVMADLLAGADFVSIHLVLSDRTRGLVNAAAPARMSPSAYLIDTSRAAIADQLSPLLCRGGRGHRGLSARQAGPGHHPVTLVMADQGAAAVGV